MNLELKHLAPYLAYELTYQYKTKSDKEYIDTIVSLSGWPEKEINEQFSISEIKPLLLPLSELFTWKPGTEISYYSHIKNKTGIDLDVDFSMDMDDEHRYHSVGLQDVLDAINMLFEYHFDIFKLIDAGLALNKNDYK